MEQKNHVQRFNEVSTNYVQDLDKNLRMTGGGSDYFYRSKLNLIQKNLSKPPAKILDFGCAVGAFTKMLAQAFPKSEVFGFDPATDCVTTARATTSGVSNLSFLETLEGSSAKFDVIVVAGVLHHIPPTEVPAVLTEIQGLLTEEGKVFVFEHNPLSPFAQLIVKFAPVDKGATLLFSWNAQSLLKQANFTQVSRTYISLFPPFLGFLAPAEKYFGWFPFSAQYLIQAQCLSGKNS